MIRGLKARGPQTTCVALIAALLLPVVVLVAFSFNADRFPSLPWRGSTLEWYTRVLSDDALLRSIRFSAKTSTTVALLSVLSGALAAWGTLYLRVALAVPLAAVFAIPVLVPPLMMGLAMRSASNLFVDPGAYWRVVLAHTVVFSPIAFSFIYARLLSETRTYEVVARDLGANAWQAVYWIHLRIGAPALASAALLIFALSWDEFTMSWLLLDVDATFPVRVWGMLEGAVSPEVNAIGTLTIACSVVIFGSALALLNSSWTNARTADVTQHADH